MRPFLMRRYPCAVIAIVIAAAPLALTGCNKLQPAGASAADTVQLLRQGSEKVCIAPDVQKTLRDLIMPKAAEIQGGMSLQDAQAAIGKVTLTYAMTTLKSFDQAVSKATCNTTVKIAGPNDKTADFQLDYEISPSAENTATFVITAANAEPSAYARERVSDALSQIETAQQSEEEWQSEQAQKRAVLAVANEKWLVGAWIGSNQSGDHCGNGQAVWFERGHVLSGLFGAGRWSLAGDQMHLISEGDETVTIKEADAISMTFERATGEQVSLRRCTRQETETLPQADAPISNGTGE